MKIVLDESVPRPVARELRLRGLDVSPFPNEWKGTKNGRLLALVEQAGFDCLLTCDKNMAHQQNVSNTRLLIAVLPVRDGARLRSQATDIAASLTSSAARSGVLNITLVGTSRA